MGIITVENLQLYGILVTSHLLGDYLFQFDELYRLKSRRIIGHLIHALIHALSVLVLFFPFLSQPNLWLFALLLFVVHGAQDILKYRLDKKCAQPLLLYIGDQCFHYLFLCTAFLFPFANSIAEAPLWWKSFFMDSPFTTYFNLLIFSGWSLAFLLNVYFRSRSNTVLSARIISTPHLLWGIMERFGITLAFLTGKIFLIILTLGICALLRKVIHSGSYWKDFYSSAILASIVGFTLFMMMKVF